MRLPIASSLVLVCSTVATHAAFAQGGYDPYRNDGSQVVRCESVDGRTRECAADTRGGVRLLRQLSRSACLEGRNWGYGRDRIWVSQGCRAEFATGYGYGDRGPAGGQYGHGGELVRCESNDGRQRQCAVDTRGGVELVRQLSRTPCIRGDSWGWNERGVWVSNGCRGEFRTGSAWGRGRPESGHPQIVRCESGEGRTQHCPVQTRGGVRLIRQLSRSACLEGRTWGRDRDGIWVSRGCRAEFEVGYRGDNGWGWGRDDDRDHN